MVLTGEVDVQRVVAAMAGIYVLLALIGRFVEAMGAVRCECAEECWCHTPGLSVFRWVFPWGHTPSHVHTGPAH